MSRRKRSRKIRSAHRHERRETAYGRSLNDVVDRWRAQLERTQARQDINDSDLPSGVKRMLGLMIDPVGFINEEMQRAVAEEKKHGS